MNESVRPVSGVSGFGFPVIDTWVNLNERSAPADFWSRPEFAAVFRQFNQQQEALSAGVDMADVIVEMNDLEVKRCLLTPFFFGNADDFLVQCDDLQVVANRFPGRVDLAPLLPLAMGMSASRAIDQATKSYELAAVRVMPALVGEAPNHRSYYPVYAKCSELQIPITINVGLPGPALPAITQQPLALDDVCRDFPDLTVVATHMGWPWHNEVIGLMLRHTNLYLMTSAWRPRYYPAEVVDFIRGRGRGRVMFASDHPLIDMRRCVEEIHHFDLEPAALLSFMRGTAESVFFSADGGDESMALPWPPPTK